MNLNGSPVDDYKPMYSFLVFYSHFMKRESICVLLTPLTHYLHGVKVYKHQCLTFLQHSSGPLSHVTRS